MTDIELNKRIHEIIGMCLHEWETVGSNALLCEKCGDVTFTLTPPKSIDFLTWEGFGIVWEFMQKHERRHDFWEFMYEKSEIDYREKTQGKFGIDAVKFWQIYLLGLYTSNQGLISPYTFAKAVVEFFEEEQND